LIRTALLLALLAGPAQALSCLPPDPVRLFEFAKQSPDPFVIVKGRILAGEVELPRENTKLPARSSVRIEGLGLTRTGFSAPVAREVTLELSCLSVWCATPPEGVLIMALKVEGDARTLAIDPCGGNAVPWTEDGEVRLLACQRDGDCRVKDF
jgi:hypothetical protein